MTAAIADDMKSGVGPDQFRKVMRHHAKGVAVITAGTETPAGFCATSLASVSLDPPVVCFAISLRATSWQTVQKARHVIVHLLSDAQEELAHNFARADEEKFGPQTRWHRDALGLPVLDDVLARLVLACISYSPVGDHALVIGRVIDADRAAGGQPLIHHDGQFTRLSGELPAEYPRVS